jgi:hypothetical protein
MEQDILIKKEKKIEFLIAVIFIIIGIILRFLPHPANFSPITAIALFGGVYLSRKIAFIIPIVVLIVSDIFIGYYEFSLMASVYASFLLIVGLGFWLKNHKKWHNIIGCTIFGSLLFFIITNFAVWALTPWYTKTITGFIQCYLMALPFFKNTFLGDLFFVPIFFGVYEVAFALVKNKFYTIKNSLTS